jgi:imidazolonepropionase-like amidohydrolase
VNNTGQVAGRHASDGEGTIAITGGYVVPVEGEPIDRGTVLISDGRIRAVAPDAEVEIPEGTRRVDAAGTWVLPGFVEAHSHLGIEEEGEGWAGDDLNEKTDPNGARLRARDGINPADLGFADALSGGITTAMIMPGSANPIGGQVIAVKCWGRTVDEMVLRDPVGVKSALGENPKRVYGEQKKPPSTRLGVAAVIREAFGKAQDYRMRRDQMEGRGEPFDRDLTLEALVRVLDGEIPLFQHAHRADDIATAIRLADEFGYRLLINHGSEAHLLADLLAERDIPVITGPLFTTRSKVELRHRTLRNPGILARAGVQVAIITDHGVVPIHFLVHQATLAMKEGLDRETALRSITINPARMLGLDDRVGALKPGLDGDVVLWSSDPLDVMSRALRVFIGGRDVYHYDIERATGVVSDPYHRG